MAADATRKDVKLGGCSVHKAEMLECPNGSRNACPSLKIRRFTVLFKAYFCCIRWQQTLAESSGTVKETLNHWEMSSVGRWCRTRMGVWSRSSGANLKGRKMRKRRTYSAGGDCGSCQRFPGFAGARWRRGQNRRPQNSARRDLEKRGK